MVGTVLEQIELRGRFDDGGEVGVRRRPRDAAKRKMLDHTELERQLPVEYVTQVEKLLAGLTAKNHPTAIEIAKTPELIRGFGTVKDAHLEEARKHEAELLEAFRKNNRT